MKIWYYLVGLKVVEGAGVVAFVFLCEWFYRSSMWLPDWIDCGFGLNALLGFLMLYIVLASSGLVGFVGYELIKKNIEWAKKLSK